MISFHQFHRQKRTEFIKDFSQLVEIVLAGEKLEYSDKRIIYRIGRRKGLTETQMDDIFKSITISKYHPPQDLSERFKQIFTVVKIVLDENKIDNTELEMATRIALKMGYSNKEIPVIFALIMIGIKKGSYAEILFMEYLKFKENKRN